MEFTYGEYVAFVDEARDRGYKLAGFDTTPPAEGALLLRHDIDLELRSSVRLAEVEATHDIRSSYFVLLTSPFYNPASAVGQFALQQIMAAGHSVGLHFDPTVPGADVRTECGRLEELIERPVDVVSYHKPAPEMFGAGRKPTWPRSHTYEACFVTDIDYCSDSTGQWRFGPPNERESFREGRSMQLLTHGDWWDEHPSSSWRRRMSSLDQIGYAVRDMAGSELGAA